MRKKQEEEEMNVVCGQACKYKKSVYCGLDFVMLNDFGQCSIWFNKSGERRINPDYRSYESGSPHECKTDKTDVKSAEGVLQGESV